MPGQTLSCKLWNISHPLDRELLVGCPVLLQVTKPQRVPLLQLSERCSYTKRVQVRPRKSSQPTCIPPSLELLQSWPTDRDRPQSASSSSDPSHRLSRARRYSYVPFCCQANQICFTCGRIPSGCLGHVAYLNIPTISSRSMSDRSLENEKFIKRALWKLEAWPLRNKQAG